MLCQATALWSGLLGKFCKVSVRGVDLVANGTAS